MSKQEYTIFTQSFVSGKYTHDVPGFIQLNDRLLDRSSIRKQFLRSPLSDHHTAFKTN